MLEKKGEDSEKGCAPLVAGCGRGVIKGKETTVVVNTCCRKPCVSVSLSLSLLKNEHSSSIHHTETLENHMTKTRQLLGGEDFQQDFGDFN